MKHLIFASATLLALSVNVSAKDYVIDNDHSSVNFTVTHLGFNHVHGKFKKYEGTFSVDGANKLTAIDGRIDAASIDTDNDKRDDHLRSPDFFDAKKFHDINFKLTKYTGNAKAGEIVGNLSMHGSKPVEIKMKSETAGPVKDPYGNDRYSVHATGVVNRRDFGLLWSKTFDKSGGLVVGNEISLDLEVEGIAKK